MRTVHVLVGGATLCGMQGPANTWPTTDWWVPPGQEDLATCAHCLDCLRRAAEGPQDAARYAGRPRTVGEFIAASEKKPVPEEVRSALRRAAEARGPRKPRTEEEKQALLEGLAREAFWAVAGRNVPLADVEAMWSGISDEERKAWKGAAMAVIFRILIEHDGPSCLSDFGGPV